MGAKLLQGPPGKRPAGCSEKPVWLGVEPRVRGPRHMPPPRQRPTVPGTCRRLVKSNRPLRRVTSLSTLVE